MGLDVLRQVVTTHESLATFRALESLLTGVRPTVPLHKLTDKMKSYERNVQK
jgi:hypothetical protein